MLSKSCWALLRAATVGGSGESFEFVSGEGGEIGADR